MWSTIEPKSILCREHCSYGIKMAISGLELWFICLLSSTRSRYTYIDCIQAHLVDTLIITGYSHPAPEHILVMSKRIWPWEVSLPQSNRRYLSTVVQRKPGDFRSHINGRCNSLSQVLNPCTGPQKIRTVFDISTTIEFRGVFASCAPFCSEGKAEYEYWWVQYAWRNGILVVNRSHREVMQRNK